MTIQFKNYMGLFGFLFKKGEDEKEDLSKINETLKSSFSNVKKDVLHLHKNLADHTSHTHNRFQEIEEKIKRIEFLLMNNRTQRIIKVVTQKEETQELEEEPQGDILDVLKGLPKAELKLFKTLYELQDSLNAKHISYKSLANYLYPGKEYNSIRSSITQFVLRLHTEGLIDKQRIGKETYVKISQNGHKLLKNAKIKKVMKEVVLTD